MHSVSKSAVKLQILVEHSSDLAPSCCPWGCVKSASWCASVKNLKVVGYGGFLGGALGALIPKALTSFRAFTKTLGIRETAAGSVADT